MPFPPNIQDVFECTQPGTACLRFLIDIPVSSSNTVQIPQGQLILSSAFFEHLKNGSISPVTINGVVYYIKYSVPPESTGIFTLVGTDSPLPAFPAETIATACDTSRNLCLVVLETVTPNNEVYTFTQYFNTPEFSAAITNGNQIIIVNDGTNDYLAVVNVNDLILMPRGQNRPLRIPSGTGFTFTITGVCFQLLADVTASSSTTWTTDINNVNLSSNNYIKALGNTLFLIQTSNGWKVSLTGTTYTFTTGILFSGLTSPQIGDDYTCN